MHKGNDRVPKDSYVCEGICSNSIRQVSPVRTARTTLMPNSGAAVMKSMALLVVSDLAAGPIVAARGVEYRFSAWSY